MEEIVGAYCRKIRLKSETKEGSIIGPNGNIMYHPVCDDSQFNCLKCLDAVGKAKKILDENIRKKDKELKRKAFEKGLLELEEEVERLRKEREKVEKRIKECSDYCPNCGKNCAIHDVKRWGFIMYRSEEDGFFFKKRKSFSREVFFCSKKCTETWRRNNRSLTIDGHTWHT